jgi:hypothetical protein
MERLEYDPFDPVAPPKRTITGPAGGLGAFTGGGEGGGGGAAAAFRSTSDVADAYRDGKISREQAAQILKNQFGISQ